MWLMQPIPYFGEPLTEGWIYEPKIDGWRLQIIKFSDGHVECWGRRLERKPNWTRKLGPVVELAQRLFPSGVLLDAEISTPKGRRYIPSVFAARKTIKPVIYIFDIIFQEGEFVGDLPLEERKRLLKRLRFKPPFHLVEHKPVGDLKAHLWEMVEKGHEGLVLKRLDSPYRLGKDAPMATENWRKVKP